MGIDLSKEEEKKIFQGTAPETNTLIKLAMASGIDFDEILFYIYELSSIEKCIRSQMVDRMKYYHFVDKTAELEKYLSGSELSTADIIKKAEEYQLDLENNQKIASDNTNYNKSFQNQQINKFLELMQPYTDFATKSAQGLINGTKTMSDIVKKATQLKSSGLIFDERRMFQIQSVKHCISIIDLKGEITPEEMANALKTDFSDEMEIFAEQVSLVQKSYNTIKDARKALEIKNINYRFIRNTINIWEIPNGTLLEFPFYGDSISGETFEMMRELKEKIDKSGMNYLIFKHIKRLYDQINFSQPQQFTLSEQRIITLHKMFNPQ